MTNNAMNLLCAKQAADLLGVSDATLAAWRSRRRGPPYVKVGRSVRYELETLREWVQRQRVEAVMQ